MISVSLLYVPWQATRVINFTDISSKTPSKKERKPYSKLEFGTANPYIFWKTITARRSCMTRPPPSRMGEAAAECRPSIQRENEMNILRFEGGVKNTRRRDRLPMP
jgi:hypothetical protein